MHSVFDLRPGVTVEAFRKAWDELAEALIAEGVMVSASGVAERRSDTPLDTDDGRSLGFFTIMSFQDRAQSEAAWDVIAPWKGPLKTLHVRVLGMVADPIFSCWEDTELEDQAGA